MATTYILRRPNQRRSCKLRRSEVADIRRWVRSEGYGMKIYEQVRLLRKTQYPDMSDDALYEVVTNASWYDPQYDRTVPWPTSRPESLWSSLLSISPHWAMILLFLWAMKRAEV